MCRNLFLNFRDTFNKDRETHDADEITDFGADLGDFQRL